MNIRKFMTYVLASNVPGGRAVPGIRPLVGAVGADRPADTHPVDLGTDMVPALALAAEPPQGNVMDEPPRPRTERLLNREMLVRAYGFLGLIETAVAMGAFSVPAPPGMGVGKSARLEHTVVQGGHHRDLRRDRRHKPPTSLPAVPTGSLPSGWAGFSNPLIVLGIVVEVALLLIMTYSPVGHWVLGTASFRPGSLFRCSLGAVGLLFADELYKLVRPRMNAKQPGRMN